MRESPINCFASVLLVLSVSCSHGGPSKEAEPAGRETWAVKLGFPKEKRVLDMHANDVGISPEASQAAESYLAADRIQSTSARGRCPAFEELVNWYKENPTEDIDLHLTLTSEWETYRWGSGLAPGSGAGLDRSRVLLVAGCR